MHHQHPRPRQVTRGRNIDVGVAVGIVLALVVAVVVVVIAIASDDGGTESAIQLSPLPPSTAPPTAPTTAVPTTVVPVAPAPELPTGDTTAEDDGPTSDGGAGPGITDPNDPAAALTAEVNRSAASVVTDVVPIGSSLYAMMAAPGGARLVRWDGVEWIDDSFAKTPASVQDIDVQDVTGDGESDFVVQLGGLDRQGGVYGRRSFSFDWLPFAARAGTVDFVGDLQVNFGALSSDPVDPMTTTTTVDWLWAGSRFVVR
jgi:hypothetical protein